MALQEALELGATAGELSAVRDTLKYPDILRQAGPEHCKKYKEGWIEAREIKFEGEEDDDEFDADFLDEDGAYE